MPAETAAHKLPYPVGSDSPPDVPAHMQALASAVDTKLGAIDASSQIAVPGGAGDAGKLLVVQNTGALAYKAMGGDATIDKDGNLQLGAGVVGATELASSAVETGKIKDSAVTAAKLASNSVETGKIKKAAITDEKLAKPIIRGQILANGLVTAGSGFGAEKTATGKYRIILDTPTVEDPIFVVTVVSGFSDMRAHLKTVVLKEQFNYEVRNNVELTDAAVNFFIMEA